ncbi:MAG: hypothetical protein RL026_1013 [Pseudomonadota bacterium]
MLSTPQISPDPGLSLRLQALQRRIRAACSLAGRQPAEVGLLAVSKGQPAHRLREAAALGLHAFGENYLNEAVDKIDALRDLPLEWHFIGRLQANKTRRVAGHFHWVHGVDRLELARRLSVQRGHYQPPLQICVQVNVLGEESKGGVTPDAVPALLAEVSSLPRLQLRGLMCMLPYGADHARQAEGFGRLQHLLEAARHEGLPVDTLSMGMSDDLEQAIAHGATWIRIGTALFGPRSGMLET